MGNNSSHGTHTSGSSPFKVTSCLLLKKKLLFFVVVLILLKLGTGISHLVTGDVVWGQIFEWRLWLSLGAGIAQWLERRTREWKIAGSNPCKSGGRIFFSRVNFLCWLLFRYPFHPHVTAVARKRSWTFWQKRKWQVTAKLAYMGCMVYTERAETAAVSCGTSHVSAVSTPLRWIFKNALYKASHSCRITCERSESARERKTALYRSNQQHYLT